MKPLTPPECDLQDFPFMPLHVARLRDSDLASEESAEACWYAVLLWAASWHQIPAASLPDNDAVLTKLVGLGRDLRTFRKHKAAAMRGFVQCDDGRLYHPVVAEQAVAAWNSKLQQRWRTECARIKKHNQRTEGNLPTPTFEQFLAALSSGQVQPCPGSVPGDNGECPQGKPIQETGTETGTGISSSVPNGTGAAAAPPDPNKEAWDRAVALLRSKARMSDASARTFFGKLLSEFRLEGRDLLGAVVKAEGLTEEPKAYLRKCAAWIAQRRGEPVGTPEDRVASWSDDIWDKAVEAFRETGRWSDAMGPEPSQPDCKAPAHVLAKHGYRRTAA